MTNSTHVQLEQTGVCATLYLAGALGRDSVPALVALCAGLPAGVRTLRVDLRAVGELTVEGAEVIRRLLLHWRSSRHGDFRLSSSHLLATWRQTDAPAATTLSGDAPWAAAPLNEALTAAYL